MKRLLKILLAVVILAVSVIGFVGCDETGDNDGKTGLLYKKFKGDDFYTVYGYKGDADTVSLDIGKLNSETVTIGRIKVGAFEDNDTLTEIIVPSTVKEIDEGAFRKMKKLEKITLPFVGANRNADAFPAETAKSVDKAVDKARTFGYIFGTESYDDGSEITNKYGAESATYYIPSTLYEVTVKAEEEYKIPMYAFSGIAQIERINIEGNVIAIGEYAFSDASALRVLNLTPSLKTIYKFAFNNCAKLCDNGIFDGLTLDYIGESAFVKTGLTELTVSVKEVGESAFAGTSLTKVKLIDTEKICAFAFYGCEKLTEPNVDIGALSYGSEAVAESAFPYDYN